MYSASRTGFLSTWSTERSYLQPHVHIYIWPCGVQWPAVLYTLTAQIQLILRGHMWCPPLSLLRGNLTPPQGAPPPLQYSQFALGKRRLLYKSTKSIILLNSNLKRHRIPNNGFCEYLQMCNVKTQITPLRHLSDSFQIGDNCQTNMTSS